MENVNQEVRDKSDRKYFTIIPNFIFKVLKNPCDFKVYCYLKKIAGEDGYCLKSVPNAAEECGMSEREFQYAKKRLAEPNPIINNRTLITIKKRFNDNGGRTSDSIEIEDIWDLNFQKFPTGAESALPPLQTLHPPGATVAHKEEPLPKKNPLEKKQLTPPTPSYEPYNPDDPLFRKGAEGVAHVHEERSKTLSEELEDPKAKVDLLKNIVTTEGEKLSEPVVFKWAKTYTFRELMDACDYVVKQIEEGMVIERFVGFFDHVLRKKLRIYG
jgi:hypothetical protein